MTQDLLRRVREEFGVGLVGVHPVGVGADARAALFRGVTADGRAYAVKTSTGPQPGVVVAARLADGGVPGVPAPLRSLVGGVTSVREGVGLSLVPWVSDRRGLDEGLEPGHWRALGAVLAALHRVPVDTPVLRALPSAGHDPVTLLARLEGLDRRLGAMGADDPHLAALLRLWQFGRDRVLAVGELARTTAADARAWSDAPRVVAHTDPHPGNVLLDDGRGGGGHDGEHDGGHCQGVWLVDWDDAALASPEWDLVFVVGGVLATPTVDDQAAFVEGYGPVDLDPVRLRFVQATRAVHDFLDFAEDVLAADRHPEAHRQWALEVLAGQLSPDGLVAFALGERGSDRLGP